MCGGSIVARSSLGVPGGCASGTQRFGTFAGTVEGSFHAKLKPDTCERMLYYPVLGGLPISGLL